MSGRIACECEVSNHWQCSRNFLDCELKRHTKNEPFYDLELDNITLKCECLLTCTFVQSCRRCISCRTLNTTRFRLSFFLDFLGLFRTLSAFHRELRPEARRRRQTSGTFSQVHFWRCLEGFHVRWLLLTYFTIHLRPNSSLIQIWRRCCFSQQLSTK